MVAFARDHAVFLAGLRDRGHRHDRQADLGGLSRTEIRLLKSGPLGGDQQIGALIAEGMVDAVIFFVDPLTPMPHDVDVKALMRLAIVYDIPMALNQATGEIMLAKRSSE